MAKPYRTPDSESGTTHLLKPGDDWGLAPLSPRQQEAETLVSILSDFIAGKPMPEPKWRKAMYCASAVFGGAQQEADW